MPETFPALIRIRGRNPAPPRIELSAVPLDLEEPILNLKSSFALVGSHCRVRGEHILFLGEPMREIDLHDGEMCVVGIDTSYQFQLQPQGNARDIAMEAAARHDPSLRLVYADFLGEHAPSSTGNAARDLARVLGPLSDMVGDGDLRLTWRDGFVTHAALRGIVKSNHLVRWMAETAAFCFLESLIIHQDCMGDDPHDFASLGRLLNLPGVEIERHSMFAEGTFERWVHEARSVRRSVEFIAWRPVQLRIESGASVTISPLTEWYEGGPVIGIRVHGDEVVIESVAFEGGSPWHAKATHVIRVNGHERYTQKLFAGDVIELPSGTRITVEHATR